MLLKNIILYGSNSDINKTERDETVIENVWPVNEENEKKIVTTTN